MEIIFYIVYQILMVISQVTGFSYNEINIIVYYIMLPFVYVFLADKILKKNILKLLYIVSVVAILIAIPDFKGFSDWLFAASVDYLLSFHLFGWNYVVSSVMVCVIFPSVVFLGMLHFAYPRFYPWLYQILFHRSDGANKPENEAGK
jgi:hypothetical protein